MSSKYKTQHTYTKYLSFGRHGKIQDTKYLFSRGQSLLEIVVAVAIISISLIGILQLVTQTIVVSGSSKFRTQASFLAQEGIEIVHNIRDTNVKKVITPWDTNFYDSVQGDGFYTMDAYDTSNGWFLTWVSASQVSDGTSLTFNGLDFIRYIKVVEFQGTDDKREVTVKVTWQERGEINSIEVSTVLADRSLLSSTPYFSPLSFLDSDRYVDNKFLTQKTSLIGT